MIRIYAEYEALIGEGRYELEDIPSLIEEGGDYVLCDGCLWDVIPGTEVTR